MSASSTAPEATPRFAPDQIDQSAATRDVPHKWVVVIDEGLPAGRAVNAAVCVAAGTVARTRGLVGDDAVDADGSTHAGLPWLGCTVLGASPERFAAIRAAAVAVTGVVAVGMPRQAQETRVYDDYLTAVATSSAEDLAYTALSLFGPRRAVDRLVRGLRLLP